jgi:hypothetical protein
MDMQGVVAEARLADKGHREKRKRDYDPIVRYSYTVGNERLSSDRILFGMSSYGTMFKSGEQRSKEWLEKYPEGRELSVAYNPSELSESTLNTGAT